MENLSRKDAKNLLFHGHKVTHKYFMDDEFVEMIDGRIIDENGRDISIGFWENRTSKYFEIGWSLYVEKKKSHKLSLKDVPRNLTVEEAKYFLLQGLKISHSNFTEFEYIKNVNGNLLDEYDLRMSWKEFLGFRYSEKFNSGWRIFLEEVPRHALLDPNPPRRIGEIRNSPYERYI